MLNSILWVTGAMLTHILVHATQKSSAFVNEGNVLSLHTQCKYIQYNCSVVKNILLLDKPLLVKLSPHTVCHKLSL